MQNAVEALSCILLCRSPAPTLRPPAASALHRADSADARLKLAEGSPLARETPVIIPPTSSFKRGPLPLQPHSSGPLEASRGLKSQHSSGVSDSTAADEHAAGSQANGVCHQVSLHFHAWVDSLAASTRLLRTSHANVKYCRLRVCSSHWQSWKIASSYRK